MTARSPSCAHVGRKTAVRSSCLSPTEIGPEDAQALEPSLAGARVIGGVHARVDRYVHPESLTRGLATHLRAAGAELREDVDVTGIEARRGGVRIHSSAGPVDAEHAIVSAGAESPRLFSQLGIRTPMIGARDYSLTIPAGDGAPRHALYLAEAKAGVSSFNDSVRIAGVFEIGRTHGSAVDRSRMRRMLASVEPYFDQWRPAEEAPTLKWSGLRPTTSDGLPLIGPAPALVVATRTRPEWCISNRTPTSRTAQPVPRRKP